MRQKTSTAPRAIRDTLQAAYCHRTTNDQELAEVLDCSPKTVHSRWQRALEHIGVRGRYPALRRAEDLGLVGPRGGDGCAGCGNGPKCVQMYLAREERD